jgi:hypothetical protein
MNVFSISAAVATFAIHDFTPDFWRFWDAAQNQPVEQQVRLWQQLSTAITVSSSNSKFRAPIRSGLGFGRNARMRSCLLAPAINSATR